MLDSSNYKVKDYMCREIALLNSVAFDRISSTKASRIGVKKLLLYQQENYDT